MDIYLFKKYDMPMTFVCTNSSFKTHSNAQDMILTTTSLSSVSHKS